MYDRTLDKPSASLSRAIPGSRNNRDAGWQLNRVQKLSPRDNGRNVVVVVVQMRDCGRSTVIAHPSEHSVHEPQARSIGEDGSEVAQPGSVSQ